MKMRGPSSAVASHSLTTRWTSLVNNKKKNAQEEKKKSEKDEQREEYLINICNKDE